MNLHIVQICYIHEWYHLHYVQGVADVAVLEASVRAMRQAVYASQEGASASGLLHLSALASVVEDPC